MKKLTLILISLIAFTLIPVSQMPAAIDNTSITAQADDNSGQTMSPTFEVRVRVKKDGIKLRDNPWPWAKVIRTAYAGETFKYTGHYLGYYIIDIGDPNHCAFISDKETDTETYTIE